MRGRGMMALMWEMRKERRGSGFGAGVYALVVEGAGASDLWWERGGYVSSPSVRYYTDVVSDSTNRIYMDRLWASEWIRFAEC